MRSMSAATASRWSTFVLVGVIALGGCTAAAPSPSPGVDPSPSTSLATPTSPGSASPAATASPTPTPSPGVVKGSWTRLDDMSAARWSFTALELLDGRVFVIDNDVCNGMSDLNGPPSPPGRTDLLNLASGRWTPGDALNATRSRFVAVRLHDGGVLVTGGDNGWHGAYSSTKRFDPATGHWTAIGLLNTARKSPIGALLADGRVLVAGGTFSEGFRDEADFFSGRDPGNRDLTSAEVYDPRTDRWTVTGSLREAAVSGTAHTLSDGRVLVISPAWASEPITQVYDPVREIWTLAGRLVQLPGSTSVLLADGSLLVVGGTAEVVTPTPSGDSSYSYVPVATVRRFDPDAGTSAEVSPLPAPRTGAVAVRLADGRVLVAGGAEHEPLVSYLEAPPTAIAYIYDPARDAWAETAPMPLASRPGEALLLADGSVLVTGGSIPYPVTDTDVCGPNAVGWTARFTLDPAGG